jgi:hypothetical protein
MVIVSPYAKPGSTDRSKGTLLSPMAFLEHTFDVKAQRHPPEEGEPT